MRSPIFRAHCVLDSRTAVGRRGWQALDSGHWTLDTGHGRCSPLTSQIHRRDVGVAERRFIGVAADTKHEIVDGIVAR